MTILFRSLDRTGDEMAAKSVQVNGKVRVTNGVDSSHLHCAGNLVERDIRIEDVLDLGEKFNDVLFVSRNNANLVERSTVNTNDITRNKLIGFAKSGQLLVISKLLFGIQDIHKHRPYVSYIPPPWAPKCSLLEQP